MLYLNNVLRVGNKILQDFQQFASVYNAKIKNKPFVVYANVAKFSEIKTT